MQLQVSKSAVCKVSAYFFACPNTLLIIIIIFGYQGLGFNIRGGFDQPYLPNDDGIFVTKIRESGSASKDGRLKEGDKIIEINDQSLVGVSHSTAVDLFVTAGESVNLLVWHGAEKQLMEEYNSKQSRDSIFPSPAKQLLIVVGVVTMAMVVYYWRSSRPVKL